jgi:glyoxalase family protein
MAERLLRNHDIRTTEQKNRDYFRAVYFREPNGILKLPRFLESNRSTIEAVLPKVA